MSDSDDSERRDTFIEPKMVRILPSRSRSNFRHKFERVDCREILQWQGTIPVGNRLRVIASD
jgi:hypothetical protein